MVDVLDFYDNRMAEKAEADRASKASTPRKLVAGAKNADESAILAALRAEPAVSMADLERRSARHYTNYERLHGFNSAAFLIAYAALRDRSPSPIHETLTSLNTLRIVAVD